MGVAPGDELLKKRKRKEVADVPKEGEGRYKDHPFLPLPIYKRGGQG